MYQEGKRLTKTSQGDLDTSAFHDWAAKDQLKSATTAQNWISAQADKAKDAGEDAQEQAWKPLANAVPGVIRGYYQSPGAVPLTVDTNGKLDVSNLVNWTRNQGGFERFNTGKASVDDKRVLNVALEGLREQHLVIDNSLPEPKRSANAGVTKSGGANHFTAIYNHVEYNVTIINGVASATPAVAAAPAPVTAPVAAPASTAPSAGAGTEQLLDMTKSADGKNFTADGGTVTVSGQPIKLTLTGTTDGKTATVTGVTGVNTVTGTTQTIDGPEAARIINHGDMSNKTPATFDVKGDKLAFKGAENPKMLLDQLGADIYVAQKYATEKQAADVNSVLEVKKGAGDAISIDAGTVQIGGKNYNLTLNGTQAGDKATIKNATLVDDAGKTTTLEGDKLNAVFNQKTGTNITYNIDNSNHVAINAAIMPSVATTIVNQAAAPAKATGAGLATGGAVNPATAQPEDKENFLEKNKFGIGAGIVGLLLGMMLGGGGFMGILIGLLLGAVALFVGGMADQHGFTHGLMDKGPSWPKRPDGPAAAPVVDGPQAPASDMTTEIKQDGQKLSIISSTGARRQNDYG